MEVKRIIPCLDVRDGKLTKGIKFAGNVDIGDPVAAAETYCRDGADELIFYDITASAEGRGIFLDVVKNVAAVVTIPFCVGGGIRSLEDIKQIVGEGAQRVSINSSAVKNPDLISQGAREFGSKAIIVGMDVKRVPVSAEIPSGYEIIINGGRMSMGIDALNWAARCEQLGAGELCVNSIDADGTREGYDLELMKGISKRVSIPIIASGGAGTLEHIYDALTEGCSDAALVASVVHYGDITIPQIKKYLAEKGCAVSLTGK